MPVYNCALYLQEALDSLMQQMFRDFELIVVDDGSTDGTYELALLYATDYENVHVLQQQHQYAGIARNLGMQHARGRYLLFLDGDDTFDPNLLKHAHACAEAADADVCVFRATSFNGETGKMHVLAQTCRAELCPEGGTFNRDTNTRNIFCFTTPAPWNKLFRASFVREHGLQFQGTRSANDFCFVMDALALAERVAVLDESLLYYRQHNAASLQATQHEQPLAFFEALRCLKAHLVEQGLFNQLEQPFTNLAYDFCMYNLRTLTAHPEQQRVVFDFLKHEGLEEMGVAGKLHDYFYVYPESRWTDLQLIEGGDYDAYAEALAAAERKKRSLPRRMVRKARRVLGLTR